MARVLGKFSFLALFCDHGWGAISVFLLGFYKLLSLAAAMEIWLFYFSMLVQ